MMLLPYYAGLGQQTVNVILKFLSIPKPYVLRKKLRKHLSLFVLFFLPSVKEYVRVWSFTLRAWNGWAWGKYKGSSSDLMNIV